jgi:hypothetical protein
MKEEGGIFSWCEIMSQMSCYVTHWDLIAVGVLLY